MRRIKTTFLFTIFSTLFFSCSQDYSPKPLGYFRIDLEEQVYTLAENNCNYKFLNNTQAELSQGNGDCWYNIYYPKHEATIYLTYKELNNNLAQIIEESHKLAYDHSVKSDGIIEKAYENIENQVFGVLYEIHGNSASNLQFFATDSVDNFIRGSLYFNTIPNADSLQPIKEYIKEDLQVLIESLQWS